MKKREFITILQNLEGFQQASLQREQYLTDAIITGDILYVVAFENGDLFDRLIIDLGCGPGRLTAGAALLGAANTVGIDIDLATLATCRANAQNLGVYARVHLLLADVEQLPVRDSESVLIRDSTVVMNPPFGKHDRNADRRFLIAAFRVSHNVYSVHLSHPKTRLFFDAFAGQQGFAVHQIYEYPMVLERSQDFHTKARKKIFVDLYHFLKQRALETEIGKEEEGKSE